MRTASENARASAMLGIRAILGTIMARATVIAFEYRAGPFALGNPAQRRELLKLRIKQGHLTLFWPSAAILAENPVLRDSLPPASYTGREPSPRRQTSTW